MKDADATLGALALFANLTASERATLSELLSTVRVGKGEAVFRQGDAGGSLYVVKTGRVRIFLEDSDGRQIVLGENGPGGVFGEISLLDGGPRTASAVAAAETVLAALDRDDLLEFLTKHPRASLALLGVMGQRLRSTNDLLQAQAARNANDEARARRTRAGRAAEGLAAAVGSWAFVALNLALAAGGLAGALALAASGTRPLGESPLWLWLAFGSGILFVQLSALLMARRSADARDRLKADIDYQFQVKAELELARLNKKLDDLAERLRAADAARELDRALGPAAARTGPA